MSEQSLMPTKDRTKRLRDLMADQELSAADVGKLIGREAQTVRSWTCQYQLRIIPKVMLELLEFKVATKRS